MLELKNIKKVYKVADTEVEALKGIDLSFRKSEFVSILGPSGCGKTTMLNIIGGLDKYTSGDLFINGRSTKSFNDRAWDTYRNHRIGFIFQSYNLIPHQTILGNVELALTIAGMKKEERIKRAKQAIDRVGLKGQYYKRPNQLSGGQCQRVAIARALVNEPEILLADEPTGALDTKTSIQIMELIKEISKDKLVIMVTHNPELAQDYSTRIINLLDGKVVSDTNPYHESYENNTYEITKKSKLSMLQAFKLSWKNLKSKFKRTALVALAASIGIVGVATVLSISNGVTNYVESMQKDMLSGNPVMINEEAMNISQLLSGVSNKTKSDGIKNSLNDGVVDVDYYIDYLVKRSNMASQSMIKNDITTTYLRYLENMPKEYYNAVFTNYNIDIANNIYTSIDINGYGTENMSLSGIEYMYTDILKKTPLKDYATYVSSLSEAFMQLPDCEEFILSQYDIISDCNTSYIPKAENEIMLVLDKDEMITDLLLGKLGYYTQDEFLNVYYKSTNNNLYNSNLDKSQFTVEELMNKTFTYYPNDVVFNKTNEASLLKDINPFTYNSYEGDWPDKLELKITCVLRPKEDVNYCCLESGMYYTDALTKKIIEDSSKSEIVEYLVSNNKTSFSSMSYNGNNIGVIFNIHYNFEETLYENQIGFLGQTSSLNNLLGSMTQGSSSDLYTLSLRDLGGCDIPNQIKIYPKNFDYKKLVTNYLDNWNSNSDIIIDDDVYSYSSRSEITYTDNLELVINVINNMIDIVTYSLVAFTCLSLVVSTVMIAIITYVSVIERIKEIGVIRSLGGRKIDVSMLFNAEAFIIGAIAGIIGIIITYIISTIINVIVGKMIGVYTIATLPVDVAITMILISIILTSLSGVIPAKLAARKDPVVALRTE